MSDLRTNLKISLFNLLLLLPCASHYLKKEQRKAKTDFDNRVKSKRKNQVYKLPDQPMREDTILARIRAGTADSRKFYTNGGKMSSSVFCAQDDHWDFIGKVMRDTIEANALWVTEFA
jgi:hypothetical protein